MKIMFKLLLFLSFNQFASAETFGPGRLYEYDELNKTWSHIHDRCTVEVKTIKESVNQFGSKVISYSVVLRDFGPKIGREKMNVSLSSIYYPNSSGHMQFDRADGQGIMKVETTSWENLLNAHVIPMELERHMSTMTNGYFGGPKYKW